MDRPPWPVDRPRVARLPPPPPPVPPLPPPRSVRPLADVYDAAYTGVPNWDIGRPQRPFVHLVESGRVVDPVLDVGCGTGELALYLASRGYHVLGIDISQQAIAQARTKAYWRRLPAHFLVWDALDLEGLARGGLSFGTVLDSAMYHILSDHERDVFIRQLGVILRTGGHVWLLGDATYGTGARPGYGITPSEVRDRFERVGGWTLAFAAETGIERRWGSSPAYFIGLRRTD